MYVHFREREVAPRHDLEDPRPSPTPAPAQDPAAVLVPLKMIPGGMWRQVGWMDEVRRNICIQPAGFRTQCVWCKAATYRDHQIGEITQKGAYCHDCTAFRARLAEIRAEAA